MIEMVVELEIKLAKLFSQQILYSNEDLTHTIQHTFDPNMPFYKKYSLENVPPNSLVLLYTIIAIPR